MTWNVFEDDVGAVLSEAITGTETPVFVVNPTAEGVADLVFALHGRDDRPAVRVLADEDVLKEALADYVVAGHAADLTAAETLAFGTSDDLADGSLLVTDDVVVSVVSVPGTVGGLAAEEAPFVAEAVEHYGDRWDAAEPYTLRSPPLSRVRETLADEVGGGAVADFDAVVDTLPAVRSDGDGFDEVTVALLVAARHGVQLYDISRWGEDVGLASKATFSRKKGTLEEAGVVTTEKVPIDVGRPRLRLRLATDRLRTADVPELTAVVQDRLAED